jgi:hypothetical protein
MRFYSGEWWIGKDVEGFGRGIIWGTFLAFAWLNDGKDDKSHTGYLALPTFAMYSLRNLPEVLPFELIYSVSLLGDVRLRI